MKLCAWCDKDIEEGLRVEEASAKEPLFLHKECAEKRIEMLVSMGWHIRTEAAHEGGLE